MVGGNVKHNIIKSMITAVKHIDKKEINLTHWLTGQSNNSGKELF